MIYVPYIAFKLFSRLGSPLMGGDAELKICHFVLSPLQWFHSNCLSVICLSVAKSYLCKALERFWNNWQELFVSGDLRIYCSLTLVEGHCHVWSFKVTWQYFIYPLSHLNPWIAFKITSTNFYWPWFKVKVKL